MRQWSRADNLAICYRKKNKLKSVYNASALFLTMNKIVKSWTVICRSDP